MSAELSPGRELDALVAEKVMGRCRWCWDNREKWLKIPSEEGFEGSSHQVGDEDEIDPLTGERVWYCLKHNKLAWTLNIPPFSTDIAASWEVMEKMRAQLPGKEIMLYYLDAWGVGSLCQAPSTIEIGEPLGEAETAPHAICLAALKVAQRGSRHPKISRD